ncbi:MAG: hypothetical protein ACR2O7_05220, partial [Parasphingorhabdus sp.]
RPVWPIRARTTVPSDAHWRAEADPWHNFGTVYGAGLFHSRKAENVATPMITAIERQVGHWGAISYNSQITRAITTFSNLKPSNSVQTL